MNTVDVSQDRALPMVELYSGGILEMANYLVVTLEGVTMQSLLWPQVGRVILGDDQEIVSCSVILLGR